MKIKIQYIKICRISLKQCLAGSLYYASTRKEIGMKIIT